jgi:hypothetical protein
MHGCVVNARKLVFAEAGQFVLDGAATPPIVDFPVADNESVNTFFAGSGFQLAKVPLRRVCYSH